MQHVRRGGGDRDKRGCTGMVKNIDALKGWYLFHCLRRWPVLNDLNTVWNSINTLVYNYTTNEIYHWLSKRTFVFFDMHTFAFDCIHKLIQDGGRVLSMHEKMTISLA